jgi:hypothetical protein
MAALRVCHSQILKLFVDFLLNEENFGLFVDFLLNEENLEGDPSRTKTRPVETTIHDKMKTVTILKPSTGGAAEYSYR